MVRQRFGGVESGGVAVIELLEQLEYLRSSCNVTVNTVAKLVGVAESTYKSWVHNKASPKVPSAQQEPYLRTAVELLQFLKDTNRLPITEGYTLIFGIRQSRQLASAEMVKGWQKLWPKVKDNLDDYVHTP